jgi:hypothetical protein
MARISIFKDEPKLGDSNPFANDVVGQFRGGYVNGRTPVSLDEWRVLTEDRNVAGRVAELLGGEPQEIEREGKDPQYEVFTQAAEVPVIIDNAEAVQTEMVLRDREFKVVYKTDGAVIIEGDDLGEPDPGYGLAEAERKDKSKKGLVPGPEVTVYFRLAADPELGIFRFFKTDAWRIDKALNRSSFYDKLDDADGPIKATLARTPQSFVAKNGPRAGQTVSFTDTELTYKGIAV